MDSRQEKIGYSIIYNYLKNFFGTPVSEKFFRLFLMPINYTKKRNYVTMNVSGESTTAYNLSTNKGGEIKMSRDINASNAIIYQNGKSQINIVKGSVVDMHVDAIVNAANSSLLGGGGVDGAIHRAAGPELLKACRQLHGCKCGEAKITGAYNIKNAKHIIHTVGPIYSGSTQDAELLSSCYRNSLDLALANGCGSIAFPGISTGVYGYPIDEAAQVSLRTVQDWINAHPDTAMDVYFCCFRDREADAYNKLIAE